MNNQLKEKSRQINQWLKENENVKEFKALEKAMNDPKLENLKDEIQSLQQQIMQYKSEGKDISILKERLNTLHDQYFNSPLVMNYAYALEEVNALFQYVNDYINGAIQKQS